MSPMVGVEQQRGGCGSRKWVPRPLVTVCRVCASPATDVQHYGSVACYSCRAFFRRSVGSGKEYKACARGSDDCVLDPVNRTNCKKCRFRKCLQIGMKPEKVDKTGRRRPQLKKEPLSVGSIADAGSIAGDVSSIDDLSDLGVELQSREISSFQDDTDSSATVGSPPAEPLGFPKMEEEDNDMEDILIDESNRVQQGYLSETGVFESSFFASLNGLEPPAVSSASSSVIVHPAGCSDTLAANNGSSRQDTSVAPWERLQRCDFDLGLLLDSCTDSCGSEPRYLQDGCTDRQLVPVSPPVSICPTPDLGLTFEEDFRIHQMIVMKENMLHQVLEHFNKVPRLVESFRTFCIAVNRNQKGIKMLMPFQAIEFLLQKMPSRIDEVAEYFRLDLFEEFSSVDLHTRMEVISYSLPMIHIIIRSYVQCNLDKQYFVRQFIAAGVFSRGYQSLYEAAIPGGKQNLQLVKAFNPVDLYIFTSPWAVNYKDEIKFEGTVTALGELVKEDVRLGTIFFLLVLVTPSPTASHTTRNHPGLRNVHHDLVLLLHRYLRAKHRNNNTANYFTSRFLSLISELQECREIHLHRRIFRGYEDIPESNQLLKENGARLHQAAY